jgi:hypothetical protein
LQSKKYCPALVSFADMGAEGLGNKPKIIFNFFGLSFNNQKKTALLTNLKNMF